MGNNPFAEMQKQMLDSWMENMKKTGEAMGKAWEKAGDEEATGFAAYERAVDAMMSGTKEYMKAFAEMPGMPKNPFAGYMDEMGKYMKPWWTGMCPAGGENSFFGMFMPGGFEMPFGFTMPGFDTFGKVFDLWKSMGEENAKAEELRKKYMEAATSMMANMLPESMRPIMEKPMEYMDTMVKNYERFAAPWIKIDKELLKRVAEGDDDAYIEFFREYGKKYEESMEKYFTAFCFGINREASEEYMQAVNEWNKTMIAAGEMIAVLMKTSKESFDLFGEKLREAMEKGEPVTTFDEFHKIWYNVTEDAFEKFLSTDEFSKVFNDFGNKCSKFMIAQNKMYERMLSVLPIPTDKDMKSLYKTVYDLRKDVWDLKKKAEEKEAEGEKKND